MKTELSNAIDTDTIENVKHVTVNVLDTQFCVLLFINACLYKISYKYVNDCSLLSNFQA